MEETPHQLDEGHTPQEDLFQQDVVLTKADEQKESVQSETFYFDQEEEKVKYTQEEPLEETPYQPYETNTLEEDLLQQDDVLAELGEDKKSVQSDAFYFDQKEEKVTYTQGELLEETPCQSYERHTHQEEQSHQDDLLAEAEKKKEDFHSDAFYFDREEEKMTYTQEPLEDTLYQPYEKQKEIQEDLLKEADILAEGDKQKESVQTDDFCFDQKEEEEKTLHYQEEPGQQLDTLYQTDEKQADFKEDLLHESDQYRESVHADISDLAQAQGIHQYDIAQAETLDLMPSDIERQKEYFQQEDMIEEQQISQQDDLMPLEYDRCRESIESDTSDQAEEQKVHLQEDLEELAVDKQNNLPSDVEQFKDQQKTEQQEAIVQPEFEKFEESYYSDTSDKEDEEQEYKEFAEETYLHQDLVQFEENEENETSHHESAEGFKIITPEEDFMQQEDYRESGLPDTFSPEKQSDYTTQSNSEGFNAPLMEFSSSSSKEIEYSEASDQVETAHGPTSDKLFLDSTQFELTSAVDDEDRHEIAEDMRKEHAVTSVSLEAGTNIREDDEEVADIPVDRQVDGELQHAPVDLSGFSMTDSMIVSSDTLEHEYIPQESAPLQEDFQFVHDTLDAEMPEELHRLKSSSYEDIYKETTFETDIDESDILLSHEEVGDKFDTKQIDEKFEDVPGKTSSFENVYEESLKEASCIEEKDVDELEKELKVFAAEVEKPEKDDSGREKTEHDDLEKDEEYDDFDDGIANRVIDSHTPDDIEEIQRDEVAADDHGAMASPLLQKYPSPIDVTYESGLDQVGQDELQTSATKTAAEEALERSQSYDGSPDVESDSRSKFRHFSTPDDVLDSSLIPYQTTMDKGLQEPGEEDLISSSSSEMARVEDVKKEMPLIPKEQEDRKSEGTEGTDVEEPFSPSATITKEIFELTPDKQLSISPVSHSPPEPISPSKEQELREEVSPLYETASKKLSVGLSPSDVITEEIPDEHAIVEEDEEIEDKSASSVYESTVIEKVPVTDEKGSKDVSHQDSVIMDDEDDIPAPDSQRIEFLSFDNIAFAGKDHIDSSKLVLSPTDGYSSQETDIEKDLDEVAEEEVSTTPVAEPQELEEVIEPHEDIDRAFQASVIDSIMERCTHDLTVDIEHEIDSASAMQVTPSRFRIGQIEYQEGSEGDLQDSTDSMDTMMEHKSATRTISSESSSDTMIASTMTASYTTASACLETSGVKQVEVERENEKSKFSDDQDNLQELLEEEPIKYAETLEIAHDSPPSIDRTESASLDSEDMEEPYGDQREELFAEMQVNIAPSPKPPSELQSARDDSSVDMESGSDDDSDKDDDAKDFVVTARPTRPEPLSLIEAKQIESISSEEPVKTSSSSDTSAEPTLLAATYDLDSGAISRVVASYDISPDTIEKTLTVETQPKAILSSPEDEVFESELLAARARDEETPSEHEKTVEEASLKTKTPDEDIEEDFEMVTESDIAGYDTYYTSGEEQDKTLETESFGQTSVFDDGITMPDYPAPHPPSEQHQTEVKAAAAISHPEDIKLPTRHSRSLEEESPSFDQSSPISSSEQSDLPPGPISPIDVLGSDTVTRPESIEEDHEEADEEGIPHLEPYVHANGPTEVDYIPEHDDDVLLRQPVLEPQLLHEPLEELQQQEESGHIEVTQAAVRAISPANIMAHASQHMHFQSEQSGDSLLGTSEIESSVPTFSLMEEVTSETDRLMSSNQTLFNLDMPSDETASQQSTSREPTSDATQTEEKTSESDSGMRSSGKGALESDSMYAMFGKDPDVYIVSKDSLTSSVDDAALDEPCEELEFFKTSQEEPEVSLRADSEALDDEEPDEELAALAEESEEPSPVPVEFIPIDSGLDEDVAEKTPELFELRPDPLDIERPLSPIPQGAYDDEAERDDTEDGRQASVDAPSGDERDDPELQVQASHFIHAVMAEATATVRAERNKSNSGPEKHLVRQSSDEIPEITVTQHLHAETHQDDYPTSYAPRDIVVEYGDSDEEEELEHTPTKQEDVIVQTDESDDEQKSSKHEDHFLVKGHDVPVDLETKDSEFVIDTDDVDDKEVADDRFTDEDKVRQIDVTGDVRVREPLELHSPEDMGDSSSVDSFATVVPISHDNDRAIDRMDEVASITSSYTSDIQPEAAVSMDVRDPELIFTLEQDQLSESSNSSEKLDLTGKLVADDESSSSSKASPDEDQYDIVQAEEYEPYLQDQEPGYILIPRRELEVVKEESEGEQKDSSGTSSSGKMDLTSGTTNSSERVYSSPDIAHSPDLTGKKFFNKSADRDDISVTSSLLEFEQLETELQEKSSESVPGSCSSKHSKEKGLERDDISVTSSLAEFERLERIVGGSDSFERMSHGVLLECVETSSTSSLAEFEKIEQELLADSDGNLDKASSKSSTTSLLEFERLEEEITIDEELESEARKVVTMLESGALMHQQISSGADVGESPPKESISQEQLVEPPDLPKDFSPHDHELIPVRSQEDIDKDSLGGSEGEREVEAIMQEASRNVEAFEPPVEATEAVLVTRQLAEAIRSAPDDSEDIGEKDSLDGRDDSEFAKDQQSIESESTVASGGAVVVMSPLSPESLSNLVPAEKSTHEIDQDSLQDSESHSHSIPIDTDSLHDQDSVMQISAESFEFDPVGPTMSTSMDSHDLMQRSYDSVGLMDRSADSLELGMKIVQGEEGLMERSVDSLELETQVPQSQSRDSFDGDSLQEKDSTGAAAMVESWTSVPRHIRGHGRMEISTESGAFSQTSSLISQDTLVSSDSGRDIMRMSIDSPEHEKRKGASPLDIMSAQDDSDKEVSLSSLKEVAVSGEELEHERRASGGLAEGDPKVTAQQPFRGLPQSSSNKIFTSPSSESSHPDSIQQGLSYKQASLEARRPVDQRPILSREEQEYGLSSQTMDDPVSVRAIPPRRLDSIEDDEMCEFDMEEHNEALGQGIPEHLAQKTGPAYVEPERSSGDDLDEDVPHYIYPAGTPPKEELLMAGDEGHLEEATGGDMQETRVVMRKQVHKKTVIRDGKEETIVTEDTHVEQDNEGPEELRDNMQTLIDQFMDGKGEIPQDPALTQ